MQRVDIYIVAKGFSKEGPFPIVEAKLISKVIVIEIMNYFSQVCKKNHVHLIFKAKHIGNQKEASSFVLFPAVALYEHIAAGTKPS